MSSSTRSNRKTLVIYFHLIYFGKKNIYVFNVFTYESVHVSDIDAITDVSNETTFDTECNERKAFYISLVSIGVKGHHSLKFESVTLIAELERQIIDTNYGST